MRTNRNFGKLSEGGAIAFAPVVLNDEHGLNTRPSAEDYLAAGYLPVVDERPETDSSHYAVATGYALSADGAGIVRTYEVREVETLPRVFSKHYLELALLRRGLLPAFNALIDSQTIEDPPNSGNTMPLRRAYETANDLSEAHPMFAQYFAAVKTALGVTDEVAEEILAACVAQ